jgi:chromosome segregation ATPase
VFDIRSWLLAPVINQITQLERQIAMNQDELAAALAALTAQTEKAKAEIVAAVAALEEALANAGSTTPEVDAALTALQAAVQGVDDLNPDA